MLLEAHVRAEARASQEQFEFIAQRATELAAAAGVAAVSTPALVALAAVSGMVAALSSGGAWIKRRIAEDPPRKDYSAAATFRRRKFEPAALLAATEQRVARGIDERRVLATASVGYATALVEDDAAERAFLRAFERAAGAFDADREDFVSARLAEASAFQAHAESSLRSLAVEASTLADAFVGEPLLGELSSSVPSLPLDELLPNDVLAVLYRSGVRIEELRRLKPQQLSSDPVVSLAQELRQASAIATRFADEMTTIDPERDVRRRR